MRRILDVRIVRWELKAAYVVAAYLLGFAIGSLLRAAELADVIVGLVAAAIDLTAILLGARVFRGRGEAIEPPRRWWRMTARPTLSWVLGILFLALWVAGVLGVASDTLGVGGAAPMAADDLALTIVVMMESGVIAALYLNSAVRLQRLGVPPREPKFKPTLRIAP
jgi:hypothetical protein